MVYDRSPVEAREMVPSNRSTTVTAKSNDFQKTVSAQCGAEECKQVSGGFTFEVHGGWIKKGIRAMFCLPNNHHLLPPKSTNALRPPYRI